MSLFGWSAIVWLLYEAANFRLDNWYYVFLPHAKVERWAVSGSGPQRGNVA